MTTDNPLFTFLKNHQAAQSKKAPVRVTLHLSKNEVSYALININPTHRNIFISEKLYWLKDQHITVFSDHTDFSKNSEYHYTATLLDSQGKTYKLRSYFDKQDNLSDPLSLKTLVGIGEQAAFIEIKQETENMLKVWIQAESSRVLEPLLAQRDHALALLKTELQEETQTLLTSVEQNQNNSAVLAELSNQAKLLVKKASKIVLLEPTFKYPLLQSIKENIEWRRAEIETEKRNAEKLSQTQQATSTTTAPAPSPKTNNTNKKATKKKNKAKTKVVATIETDDSNALLNEFEILKNAFSALLEQAINPTAQSETLQTLLTDITRLECQVSLLGSTQCQKLLSLPIEKLRTQITLQGQLLLQKAIDDKSLDQIKNLLNYFETEPVQILKYAINTNDAELMNLAFKKYSYALNRISLKDEAPDSPATSPLLYAYKKRSEKAFEILLNNNANPLSICENNLPLLHNILKDASDTAFYPLMHQKLMQIGHHSLLQQMIILLEEYLNKTTELTQEEALSLRNNIKDYQELKTLSCPASNKLMSAISKKDAKLISTLRSNLPEDLLEELETDEEFQLIKEIYVSAQINFMNSLSSIQFMKLNSLARQESCDILDHTDLIKSALNRETIIGILKGYTAIFPKYLRMIEIQHIANNSRSNKSAKKLQAESVEIQGEVKTLHLNIVRSVEKQLMMSTLNSLESALHTEFNKLINSEKVDSEEEEEYAGVDFAVTALDAAPLSSGQVKSMKQAEQIQALSNSMNKLFDSVTAMRTNDAHSERENNEGAPCLSPLIT